MPLRLFPNQSNLFDLFEKQVAHAVEAARFFKGLVAQDRVSEEMLSKMAEIKHQGDIYQDAETVLDVCEDAIHVVDSVMVKQA